MSDSEESMPGSSGGPDPAEPEERGAVGSVPPRSFSGYVALVARGCAMGSADVVPGVSGGTMAFILGIYEELIANIRMVVRPAFWRPLVRGHLREAFSVADVPFLAAVLAGILFAVFTLARVLSWLLENRPVLVWSFFFGLVLASVVVVARRVSRWDFRLAAACAAGAVGAFFLVGAVPAQTPEALWFIFLSGVVAVCAMILPGISGAFILVLLGKYEYVLAAVNERNVAVLAVLVLGGLVGIVSFAQLLGWLFRRFRDPTVAVLIGLLIGSLRKIWPWKEVPALTPGASGVPLPAEEVNVLPPLLVDGVFNAEIVWAVLLALAGLLLVVGLDLVARRKEGRPPAKTDRR